MLANIGFGVVGAGAVAAVVGVSVVHWDKIQNSPGISSLTQSLQDMYVVNDLAIALENQTMTHTALTETELKYKPYSESEQTSGTEDLEYGQKYGKLLMSASESDNDTLFQQQFSAHKTHIPEEQTQIFKGIKGTTSEIPKTVKAKCEEAYKKKESEINDADVMSLWSLCSVVKFPPGHVVHRVQYKNKFGMEENYRKHLLENRLLNANAWEALYEKVLKTATDTKSEEFSKVTKGYDKTKGSSSATSLNHICEAAYVKATSEFTDTAKAQYKQDVLKYCNFTNVKLT